MGHAGLAMCPADIDGLIARSLPSLSLALDAGITTQQAQTDKPDPRLFRFAHAMLGVTPDEMIHVVTARWPTHIGCLSPK